MTSGGTEPILGVGVGGGFSPGALVLVEEDGGSPNWIVKAPFAYGGKKQVFEVCVGESTDFASVPRILVWFLPRYGRYTLPAILHDHLWRVEAPAGRISYRDADATLRRAMREKRRAVRYPLDHVGSGPLGVGLHPQGRPQRLSRRPSGDAARDDTDARRALTRHRAGGRHAARHCGARVDPLRGAVGGTGRRRLFGKEPTKDLNVPKISWKL